MLGLSGLDLLDELGFSQFQLLYPRFLLDGFSFGQLSLAFKEAILCQDSARGHSLIGFLDLMGFFSYLTSFHHFVGQVLDPCIHQFHLSLFFDFANLAGLLLFHLNDVSLNFFPPFLRLHLDLEVPQLHVAHFLLFLLLEKHFFTVILLARLLDLFDSGGSRPGFLDFLQDSFLLFLEQIYPVLNLNLVVA